MRYSNEKIILIALSEAQNLRIDSTYKIILNNFTVIIMGYTNTEKKFFFGAAVLCEQEDFETHQWFIDLLRNKLLTF